MTQTVQLPGCAFAIVVLKNNLIEILQAITHLHTIVSHPSGALYPHCKARCSVYKCSSLGPENKSKFV